MTDDEKIRARRRVQAALCALDDLRSELEDIACALAPPRVGPPTSVREFDAAIAAYYKSAPKVDTEALRPELAMVKKEDER
jgi:hypothetical protein